MQIVIVCDYGDVNGGAARVAISSARGLAEAGAMVSYVYAVPPLTDELRHPRIACHRVDAEDVWQRGNPVAAAAQGIWNRHALGAVEAVLAQLPPDETVLHFHQWTKALSPSVLAAAARRGLPGIVSLHDYFLVCPTGLYYQFTSETPCRYKPMSLGCVAAACDRKGGAYKSVRVLRQMATQRVLARAGHALSMVSVSPFADTVVEGMIDPLHPRYVVRSPVDIARSPPVAVADNDEFLFVGRLTAEKGIRQLAEVAREAGLRLAVAGDGPLLAELRALGGSVRCTGWLDGAAVAAEMNRARVLVFPSTWYETGGLVVLEALARGIPVIVSRSTGPADLVTDGENGFVIDDGDRAALRARMDMLRDPELARRMGEAAYRRYWAAPQTREKHTRDLMNVYRTVLERHRATVH